MQRLCHQRDELLERFGSTPPRFKLVYSSLLRHLLTHARSPWSACSSACEFRPPYHSTVRYLAEVRFRFVHCESDCAMPGVHLQKRDLSATDRSLFIHSSPLNPSGNDPEWREVVENLLLKYWLVFAHPVRHLHSAV